VAVRVVRQPDADFQVLDALRRNRRKRRQHDAFLIHGVRAIDAAGHAGWPVSGLITRADAPRSRWADGVLAAYPDADRYEVASALFDDLAERDESAELIVIGGLRRRRLDEIVGDGVVVVVDRPAGPGNLGSLVRSADALGAAGVVVVGHAADPYDPACVRASVGALFAVPVVELGSAPPLVAWLASRPGRVLGLDESAKTAIGDAGGAGVAAIVLGNEARGMSQAMRDLCDDVVAIPMKGMATSLNIAVAGSIALYALTKQ
jgi:23S rRNA (uridine2479-2'-O)-methyltransferase